MQETSESPPDRVGSIPNPFLDDIYVPGKTNLPGASEVHQQTMTQCVAVLESLVRESDSPHHWGSMGRTILLSAPRAGYGKSHLVGRIRSTTESVITAIDLPFDPARSISWPAVLASILRQYSEIRCAQDRSCSIMDETARFFLASMVRAALAEESFNEKGCPESDAELQSNFRNLFSSSSKSKILGWTDKRSVELAQAASVRLKSRWGIGSAEVSFWARLFLDFTLGHEDALEPLRGLSPGEARQRTIQFLRIATECRPAILIVDHLDGFYGSDHAGMAIIEIIASIRMEVCKSVSLLCINNDLWTSVFQERLPSAWLDRLTGDTATLPPISAETAKSLIRHRLDLIGVDGNKAFDFSERLGSEYHWSDPEAPLHPRAVIRQGRAFWEMHGSEYYSPKSATLSVSFPEPEQPVPTDEPVPTEKKPEAVEEPVGVAPKSVDTPPETIPQEPIIPTPVPLTPPQPVQEPVVPDPETPATFTADHSDIRSIIDDIRGTGKSALSEAPKPPEVEPIPREIPKEKTFQAGDLTIKPISKPPVEKEPIRPPETQPVTPPGPIAQSTLSPEPNLKPAPSLEDRLRSKEAELQKDSGRLALNLKPLEAFIRKVGSQHAALCQEVQQPPSSETPILRWKVRDLLVNIAFEPPRNVYFWNSLLQKSIASGEQCQKISAFSHRTQPFDPGLFRGFGFSGDVVSRQVDIVELNDHELAILYASEAFLNEAEREGQGREALRLVTRKLDPLWRRISKPLA